MLITQFICVCGCVISHSWIRQSWTNFTIKKCSCKPSDTYFLVHPSNFQTQIVHSTCPSRLLCARSCARPTAEKKTDSSPTWKLSSFREMDHKQPEYHTLWQAPHKTWIPEMRYQGWPPLSSQKSLMKARRQLNKDLEEEGSSQGKGTSTES